MQEVKRAIIDDTKQGLVPMSMNHNEQQHLQGYNANEHQQYQEQQGHQNYNNYTHNDDDVVDLTTSTNQLYNLTKNKNHSNYSKVGVSQNKQYGVRRANSHGHRNFVSKSRSDKEISGWSDTGVK